MHPRAEERHGAVRNWMTREPITVPEDCSVGSALAQMQRREIRHLLVVDGDRLSGIVSNRDVSRLALDHPDSRLLLELRIGALPVRDGDEIVGIFTTADALEALLAMVENPGA